MALLGIVSCIDCLLWCSLVDCVCCGSYLFRLLTRGIALLLITILCTSAFRHFLIFLRGCCGVVWLVRLYEVHVITLINRRIYKVLIIYLLSLKLSFYFFSFVALASWGWTATNIICCRILISLAFWLCSFSWGCILPSLAASHSILYSILSYEILALRFEIEILLDALSATWANAYALVRTVCLSDLALRHGWLRILVRSALAIASFSFLLWLFLLLSRAFTWLLVSLEFTGALNSHLLCIKIQLSIFATQFIVLTWRIVLL